MEASEVASLLIGVADSIEQRPDQFHIRIMNVGMSGQGGSGGPGVIATAIGGAPGSTAIGARGSASSGNANQNVMPGEASSGTTEALAEVSAALRELAQAAEAEDKGRVSAALNRVKELAATPAMVVGLANSLLALAHLL